MPEGDMEFGGDDGGKDGGGGPPVQAPPEALTLPGADVGDLPAGSCGEVIRFIQEQWRVERDRADRATRESAEARERLAQAEADLARAREALDAAERRHAIDLRLLEEGTVDIESARLLTELAVSQTEDGDVEAAVSDLRKRKPFLFGRGRSVAHAGASMAAAAVGPDPLEQFAEEALRTGDRAALMRYLRARRGG